MGLCAKGFSQTVTSTTTSAATTSSTDFFAGKWEITVAGTPVGDAKFVTDLVRKDGKLTGELKDPTGTRPNTPITKVEDEKEKITIYFDSQQAGEIPIVLSKVDNDNLKGQMMDMFEASAKRVKP